MIRTISRQTTSAALYLVLILANGAAIAAEATTPIPATSAEIWQAIDHQVQEMHTGVANGAMKGLHEHAFAVRD